MKKWDIESSLFTQIYFELMDCEDQLAVTIRDAHFRFYVHYIVDPSGIATRNSRSQNGIMVALWLTWRCV